MTGQGRVVYGVNPVRELLERRPRTIQALYVAEGETKGALRELRKLAAGRGVTFSEVPRLEIDAVCGPGARHQGVAAICGQYEYHEIHSVLDQVGTAPLVVVLDSVQDPRNLGAIVRSAHVMGAHAVVIAKDRAAPVTAVTVKASAGATEHIPICQVVNIARTLEELKERNLWTIGAVVEPDARLPWEMDLKGAVALVLGAEGKGLRPLVRRHCDQLVRIPMAGRVGSLNVSVAAGVLLYEVSRQRSVSERG